MFSGLEAEWYIYAIKYAVLSVCLVFVICMQQPQYNTELYAYYIYHFTLEL